MKIIENPRIDTWKEILQRPAIETGALFGTVSKVLDDVRLNGDEALRRYELEFDHVSLEKLNVEDGEFYEAVNYIPEDLKKAIDVAYSNIHKFHSAQRFEEIKVETRPESLALALCPHFKSGFVYSRRNSTFILYSFNACYSG